MPPGGAAPRTVSSSGAGGESKDGALLEAERSRAKLEKEARCHCAAYLPGSPAQEEEAPHYWLQATQWKRRKIPN